MKRALEILSSILGAGGALLCLFSGVARVAGFHLLAGFESFTLFIAGIALMVAAIMGRLHLVQQDIRERCR